MVKAICFYLPQYHPVKENNQWWGEGFTEWRNVAKAHPNFADHYQPHVPSDLGFYDLRMVEVQRKQAELARSYGIAGFCYYFYWFNGRRILERPLDQMLRHPEIDMPFCVCWANENWTRTWDGKEKDILLGQKHNLADDAEFMKALIPMFRDPRYIRVDGKPMVVIYRVDLFPHAKETARLWRTIAQAEGFPDLHLCCVQFYGVSNPADHGFDAAVEFPPHGFINERTRPDAQPTATNRNFRGTVLDYRRVVNFALNKSMPDFPLYRGVMPSWDNTARRQDTPHIFIGSSPADYQYWLSRVVEQTRRLHDQANQFVFINAWNEWGEGCHLEPDLRYGHGYLRATKAALQGASTVEELLLEMKAGARYRDGSTLSQLAVTIEERERVLYSLQQELQRKTALIEEQGSRLARVGVRDALKARLNRYPRMKTTLKRVLGLVRGRQSAM